MRTPDSIDATLAAPDGDIVDVRHCALEVLDGPASGRLVDPVPPRALIGRQPWCDLVLPDPQVSAMHCEVLLEGDAVRLRDLGSTNGVWAGGARLLDAVLEPGVVLRVGGTRLGLTARGTRRQVRRPSADASGRLIGVSPAMGRLFDMLARVAARDLPVLLLGETGTGKSAVAAALHAQSPRKAGPFVSLNCAALPADLVESTLFGHVKGAFTGAHRDTPGVFREAHGGTLFLDELGELPLAMQPKLLSALETGRVRPVGGDREVPVDLRLVTATNRNLWEDVGATRFRQDLYYRVAGIELLVPALRERLDDIGPLADAFLRRMAGADAMVRREPALTPGALSRLKVHTWPGNVRELHNVIARAAMLAGDGDIRAEHVVFRGWEQPGTHAAPEEPGLDVDFKSFKADLLARHEAAYFARLMERVEGNLSRGAREAGISRTWLLAALRRYGLHHG